MTFQILFLFFRIIDSSQGIYRQFIFKPVIIQTDRSLCSFTIFLMNHEKICYKTLSILKIIICTQQQGMDKSVSKQNNIPEKWKIEKIHLIQNKSVRKNVPNT